MTIAPTELTLTEELAAIEAVYPGWVLHPSDEGVIWIDHVSGVPSLRAPTPLAARRVIAEWEHTLELQYATCDTPGCTHDHGSHIHGTGPCGFCGCGAWVTGGAA